MSKYLLNLYYILDLGEDLRIKRRKNRNSRKEAEKKKFLSIEMSSLTSEYFGVWKEEHLLGQGKRNWETST